MAMAWDGRERPGRLKTDRPRHRLELFSQFGLRAGTNGLNSNQAQVTGTTDITDRLLRWPVDSYHLVAFKSRYIVCRLNTHNKMRKCQNIVDPPSLFSYYFICIRPDVG